MAPSNPSQAVAVTDPASQLPANIADEMPNGQFGGYPTDPTNSIRDIIKYLDGTGDYRFMIHGIYDAVGFILKMIFGDPSGSPIDPVIMAHAFMDLNTALAKSPKTAAIPPLVLTILTQALQAFLLWWQSRQIKPNTP